MDKANQDNGRTEASEGLENPNTKYPGPPFRKQLQPWPGLAAKMDPRPDHGEASYKGSGRLTGRKALITRGNDQFVAVVGADSRLHYSKIAVGSTDGDTVTLAGGIAPGSHLAVDLPAEAADGVLVRPVMAPAQH